VFVYSGILCAYASWISPPARAQGGFGHTDPAAIAIDATPAFGHTGSEHRVRGRLALAAVAVVAAVVVFVVGLLPGAASRTPAGSPAAGFSIGAAAGAPSESTSPTSAASNPALTANMRLVLDATFTRPKLDKSIWDTCYPWIAHQAQGCTNFSNTEIEWYKPSQVQISDGVLNLVARRIPTTGLTQAGARHEYQCRSGMVTTHPGFNFEYGYVQVVARIPNGKYLWPALWLAASNYQWPPEMDILEHWGPPANFSGAYFHPSGAETVNMRIPPSIRLADTWHTYALDWTPSQMTWYIDGQALLSVDQDIPHQDMYFIANVASNGSSQYSPCSGTLQISSVKVWQS
jgi:beta-glucanase (GH16 family)